MDLPQEIDDYLRESLEYALGHPVSARTLELNIRSSEEIQRHIRDQCFILKSKLSEKDRIIECVRAESSMNAHALKKFSEENQKLITEHTELLARCAKWDVECTLYERDIEALKEFGNQADERAKEAESRVLCLEDETSKLWEELQSLKKLSEGEFTENFLIDTFISSFINEDEVASASLSFLEADSRVDLCQKMLKIWDGLVLFLVFFFILWIITTKKFPIHISKTVYKMAIADSTRKTKGMKIIRIFVVISNILKPATHTALALASEVKNLQKDKDMLRMNLIKAEEENCERKYSNSAVEKIDFSDAADSPRKLLSRCYITHSPCNLI
ncbi:hypothetical protein HanIR_Chr02g0074451 [Helianthus annuus]|nr:hypothetical protein HanIR_Chr02g0074451 [Helianthus annuus]